MATILKSKKAVLLRLKEPSRVTAVIPTAKLITHKGQTLVAAPHRPDETQMLRHLGFNIPDPMKLHYEWPKAAGQFDPFQAQTETATFASMNRRCFILNSMGTGKTVSSLWAFDYLKNCKQVKRALIVCPLSTMERTWADEVFKTFPHLDATVVYGDRKKRAKLLAQPSDLYIINIDGIKIIEQELANRPDIDLIIVDEIAMFRNAGTDRWKTLNRIVNKQSPRKAWGLTGMPTPNSPTDAWAQCRVIVPNNEAVPHYYGKARDQLMKQITQFKWVPRANANDIIKEWMQPSIRFSLDDVVDLPEQIFITRDVELSPEQRKAYTDMLASLRAEYEGGEILAVNEAVKANKLIQISCGVAYGANGEDIVIPAPQRISVLREIIEGSEGKVIVFVPLTGALEHVAKDLSDTWDVRVVHGGIKKAERDEIFHGFQTSAHPQIIVANPLTMSHGLTLTKATTIVWFAPVHSNDTYEQACARVRRPGQTRSTVIVHIAGSEVERRIYTRLKTKQNMQGLLLDMMKEL